MSISLAAIWLNFVIVTTGAAKTPAIKWKGGSGTVFVAGTVTGTVKLQYCPVNSATDADWVDVGDTTTFTNVGLANFALCAGFLRLNCSTTGATVYYKIGGNGIGGDTE